MTTAGWITTALAANVSPSDHAKAATTATTLPMIFTTTCMVRARSLGSIAATVNVKLLVADALPTVSPTRAISRHVAITISEVVLVTTATGAKLGSSRTMEVLPAWATKAMNG